jgi:hypothetical protein
MQPAATHRVLARSKLLIQQRNILEHPAIERCVVNLDIVLFHHFLELTVDLIGYATYQRLPTE